MFTSVFVVVFPVLMAFAAAFDLLTMRIPNWISIVLIAAFVPCAFLIGMPITEMGLHFAVGFAVLLVAFLLFLPGWIGGGDAKFAAAVALWMGPEHVLAFLVVAAFFGGVQTALTLLFRWKYPQVWLPKIDWVQRLHDRTVGVPYGISLAAGAMFIYTETGIFQSLIGS